MVTIPVWLLVLAIVVGVLVVGFSGYAAGYTECTKDTLARFDRFKKRA
jgi:hypothetical protein